MSGFKVRRAPQFLIWVTRGPFAGQVITGCNDVGGNNKATVISNLDLQQFLSYFVQIVIVV